MAIFKLKPSCKDYLWGGTRLRTEFGIEYDRDPLAESWELSCHPDGPSYIVNGEYAGKTLQQYIDENGKEILGTDCQSFEQFPVLIKFIDAKKDLSIQVHPDNAYGQAFSTDLPKKFLKKNLRNVSAIILSQMF